jgi:hypothetical protein
MKISPTNLLKSLLALTLTTQAYALDVGLMEKKTGIAVKWHSVINHLPLTQQ